MQTSHSKLEGRIDILNNNFPIGLFSQINFPFTIYHNRIRHEHFVHAARVIYHSVLNLKVLKIWIYLFICKIFPKLKPEYGKIIL